MYDADDYVISRGGVTLKGTPLKGADPATFRHLYGHWSADRRSVYWSTFRRTKIDAASFEPLNDVWGRDADAVYMTTGKPLAGVKPTEFRVYDSGVQTFHALRISHPSIQGYGGDSRRVFFHQETYAGAREVKGADPATLVNLGAGYARDDSKVFFEHRRVRGADPRSFHLPRRFYAADRAAVYRAGHVLEGADPQSFVVLGPGDIRQFARDRHGYYDGPRRTTRERYIEALTEEERSLRDHRAKVKSGEFDEEFQMQMVDFRP